MAVSINRVVISGNLTRDPELRSTQNGTNIMTFGVAVNDRRRNPQTLEWEDYPNFIDCVLFGARTEFLSRTLRKGLKVVVEGRLRYSSWEKDGARRSKIEVIADDIDFVSPRQQSGYGQNSYEPQQQSQAPSCSAPAPMSANPLPQRPSAPAPQNEDVYEEDDIPF
jgi:single-strand DNA-binding protein